MAATLRASPWDTFWHVMVPLAQPGFLTGAILGFAHTIGEFGVVLMIGSNIPASTGGVGTDLRSCKTMGYAQAHWLAGGMVAFSLTVLLALYPEPQQRERR